MKDLIGKKVRVYGSNKTGIIKRFSGQVSVQIVLSDGKTAWYMSDDLILEE